MAPIYKLTYFDVRGLAEPIRFMLSYGGQEFEDVRLARENWPELKNTMPFGKVPVLEVDGKKVCQSNAICRYLAHEFKLAGSNEWEDLQIDIAVDTINDFKDAVIDYFMLVYTGSEDKELIAKKKETLFSVTMPFYLPRLDELVKSNDGHFANGKLTWADVYFTAHSDGMAVILGSDWLTNYPHLTELRDKVFALPAIKAWVEKRPKAEF